MKSFLPAAFFCAALLSLPFAVSAQTPQPVVKAYDALYGNKAYKMDIDSKTVVDFLGAKINTAIKGSGYQDLDGDVAGKVTVSISFADPDKKGWKKFSVPVEYKYFPNDETLYFKFGKLPKEAADSMKQVRQNTWYVQKGTESLTALTGQSPLASESFIAANEKYPAITFVEKGSTNKEYVYMYSVNQKLLLSLLEEIARTGGETLTPSAAKSIAEMMGEAAGTMRISKKTELPTLMTLKVSNSMLTVETKAKYSFGGSKQVTPEKNAIASDAAEGLFGGF